MDRGFTSEDAEHWDDALDDGRENDHEVPVDVDGRSPARTGFNPNGTDYKDDELNNPKKWDRLDRINHETRSPEYTSRQRHEDKIRNIDIVGSFLDTTEYQRDRCKHIVKSIDDLSEITTNDSIVAFATMTLVVNEDNRHIQTEDVYDEMIEELGTSRSAVHSARERIREYL